MCITKTGIHGGRYHKLESVNYITEQWTGWLPHGTKPRFLYYMGGPALACCRQVFWNVEDPFEIADCLINCQCLFATVCFLSCSLLNACSLVYVNCLCHLQKHQYLNPNAYALWKNKTRYISCSSAYSYPTAIFNSDLNKSQQAYSSKALFMCFYSDSYLCQCRPFIALICIVIGLTGSILVYCSPLIINWRGIHASLNNPLYDPLYCLYGGGAEPQN